MSDQSSTRLSRRFHFFAVFVLILTYPIPSNASAQETHEVTCLSTEVSATLWSDANMGGPEVGTVKCGDTVSILSPPSASWIHTVKVQTSDGKVGYLPGRFVGIAPPPPPVPAKVNAKLDKKIAKICAAHHDWTMAQCSQIAQGHIEPGMTTDMVREAWGNPNHVSTTSYENGHRDETWLYTTENWARCLAHPGRCNYSLDFEDGILKAMSTAY